MFNPAEGDKRKIAVFIASPGDLAVERRAFRDCVDELNIGFGDGARVEFEAVGWEDTLASTGRRSQGVISAEIDRCDVFILTMHTRWGQDAPDSNYSSYTEEEFHLALKRFKRTGSPEIFVILKRIPPIMMADPGKQLQQVLDFRRELEKSRQVLYHEFDGPEEFSREIDRHLRAFAKGELPRADQIERDIVVLPVESIQAVRDAEEKAQRAQQRAKAALQQAEAANQQAEAEKQRAEALEAGREKLALQLAQHASQAALDGHVEEAKQSFARVTEATTNPNILFLAFSFYFRIGDLATAEQMLRRWLALSGPDAQTDSTAGAYGNLWLIYQTRGELDELVAIEASIDLIRIADTPGAVVINAAPVANPLTDQALTAIAGYGVKACPVIVHQRIEHVHAFTAGSSASESAPSGKAAAEINELFNWTRSRDQW